MAQRRGTGQSPVGLDLLATLESDSRMARHHRLPATRAHLLELAGEHDATAAQYREAARLTTSLPERRYLTVRSAEIGTRSPRVDGRGVERTDDARE